MALRGRIDDVRQGVLRGWLWDPDRPDARLNATLWLDGASFGTQRADLPRADLEQAGFGDGGWGVAFALPIAAQDGAAHDITLEAEQDGFTILVDQLSLVIPRRLHMLRGRAERVRGAEGLGWAFDSGRPEQPVMVELLHEGRVLARQPANRPRPDLARLRIGDGRHGFAFNLAALLSPPPEGAPLELRCIADFGEWPLGRLTMPAAGGLARMLPASRRDHLAAARKAEGERDYAEAARRLDAALLSDPHDFDLISVRARVHLAQQEFEPAERLARRALERSPGHPRALVLLGRIATALGQHEAAVGFWAGIGPDDAAFRERLAKRSRSLLAIGRTGEAMSEMALALRARPDDPEALRQMAETAEAVGALRAARLHWRRLLAHLPEDRIGVERLAALQRRLAPAAPEPLPSPLANPHLRDWSGPIEAVTEGEAARPAAGLTLRSLGGTLRFAVAAPREQRPGELPEYGIRLAAEGQGAEASFALTRFEAEGGLRMGLDITAEGGPRGILLALRRRAPDGAEAGERALLHPRGETRPRLHRFDLHLTGEEQAAQGAGGLELVLRLTGPGTVLLYPPRPLSRLPMREATGHAGFEAPELAGVLRTAAGGAARGRSDALIELGCPFTTITIAAPDVALPAVIQGVLRGTASPFECVLTEQPDWPAPLVAALHSLAAIDPRFRLLPPDAASAQGWVALIEAPPEDGPNWLVALHAAAGAGSAEAPGVLLAWCD